MSTNEENDTRRKSRRDLSSLRPSRPSETAPAKRGTLPAPGGVEKRKAATAGSLAPPRSPSLSGIDEVPSESVPPLAPPRDDDAPSTPDTFVTRLQAAELLTELPAIGAIPAGDEDEAAAKRLDLLEHYYAADGDTEAMHRRCSDDGFFCFRESDLTSAKAIVEKLSGFAEVLKEVQLEKLGAGDDVELILRHGEHRSVIIDERWDDPDTGEVDLRELEFGPQTISVCSIIRSLNSLIARSGGRRRLIPLRGDGEREVYLAATVTNALSLARDGLLEIEDAEGIMDFGSW